MRSPVTIQVSRQEVERVDTSRLVGILDGFIPDLCARNRNRVDIEVLGYGDDERELFDIPEVKRYFRHYFDNHSGWFYWVNTESQMFPLMGLLLFTPVRVGRNVTISGDDLKTYLLHGFVRLNAYCQENGLAAEPSTKAINDWIRDRMGPAE